MGGKKTNSKNNKSESSPAPEEHVADTAAAVVAEPEPTTTESDAIDTLVEIKKGGADEPVAAAAPASKTIAADSKSKAQEVVVAAVEGAKEVAKVAVDKIKDQIGEEKTQMAIDYATKAKQEIEEVVDYAKDAVVDATNKARVKATEAKDIATEKLHDAKELTTAKYNEAKDKTTAKYNEAKDIATEKVTETVDYVKAVTIAKTEVPRKKATDAVEWLKADVHETALEHTTVDVATFLISTTLTVGNSALGVVGLDAKAARAVTSVRNGVTGIATSTPIIQSTHAYAAKFWPYRLVARMVVNVDNKVRDRLAPHPDVAAPETAAH